MQNKAVKIFSGPMGTELQKRGFATTLPLWSGTANLEVPGLVKEIHEEYIKAGSDFVITNTFRTNSRPWKTLGREKDAAISTKKAIEIAVELKSKYPHIKVGGSITTLEDCYEIDKVPPQNELEQEHGEQVELFKGSGVDFMMIETVNTIREAETIARFCVKAKLPIWVSVVTDEKGNLMSGETMQEFVKVISQYNPEVLGVNCRPPEIIIHGARKLAEVWKGSKLIYANGDGQPANDMGWEFYDRCSPKDYLDHAREWVELGFDIIGSCCGSGPEYIQALVKEFKV